MKTIEDLLAEQPFFEGLDPDAFELIAGCSHLVHYAENEQILVEGDPADEFYVIRSGRVAIEVATPNRGPFVIETLGAGQILGVSWLLPPYRWNFDARAVEETGAVAIHAGCLRSKCDDDARFGYDMFKRFAGLVRDRLQAARFQLLDVYGDDAA